MYIYIKSGGGYCRLRYCCLESADVPRTARRGAVGLSAITLRGQARKARTDKFELEKLELRNLGSMRVSDRIIPHFRRIQVNTIRQYQLACDATYYGRHARGAPLSIACWQPRIIGQEFDRTQEADYLV